MIVKMKPLEQVLDEFGFIENSSFTYYQKENHWYINKDMVKYFGKEVEVFEDRFNSIYGYYLKDGNTTWCFHSSWFEPEFEDFLSEDEFEL